MKIINQTPIFNLVNNSFVYLCQCDDQSYWVRSSAGNWVQIKDTSAVATEILDNDFQEFLAKDIFVSEDTIKIDNSAQTIVEPTSPPPQLS